MRLTTLLFLAFCLSHPLGANAAKAVSTDDFMVLYSNNVSGEFEPCG